MSREELDLVRVYLSHVGKRKLLKAREEQELGRRIEDARGDGAGRAGAAALRREDARQPG